MQQVKTLDPATAWGHLSLIITDHAGMAHIHAASFGTAQTTDVISFAYPPTPPIDDESSGEVIVNVEQALEQGTRYDGPARELALYIAHGCQHLTGADDSTPALKRQMRRVESRWLDQAAGEGLIDPIWPAASRRERP